ncbi:MAG: hypothetical protein PHW60_16175 [Kiritimatiellae bacterium]|nr:hypothetical protein [Kiritimatiellia bacterium]
MNLKPANLKQLGQIILILLPFAFLLACIFRFAIDMPYMDEWDWVPFLQKFFEGSLTLGDLFDQHNECRIFFPRLVVIPLAYFTGWNINAEVTAIVLISGLMFLLLASQAVRICRECIGGHPAWLTVVIAFMFFSVMQYENWTFGFTLVGFMNIAAAIIGLMLLAHPVFSWPRFLGALLAGAVAMYSFSNGIIFWVVGPLTLLAVLREDRKYRIAPWVAWVCSAAVLVALFLYKYEKPPWSPSVLYFFYHADVFLGYFFAVLGGAIANTPQLPVWVPVTLGAIGCILFCAASLICISRGAQTARAISFWVSLGSYGALSCMAVAFARSANGIPHALEGRYIILSNLFWIATLVMTVVAFEFAWRASALRGFRSYLIALKAALVIGMLVCAGLFTMSSVNSLALWQSKYDSLIVVRDELLCFAPDQSLLARTFLDPVKLKRRMEFLTRRGLSAFREKKLFRDYKVIPVQAGCIETGRSNSPPATGFQPNLFYFSGRAYNPGMHQPARGVLFVNTQDVVVARAHVSAAADFSQSSWKIALSAVKFPAGTSRLQLYAVLRDGDLLAPIGALDFDITPPVDSNTLAPIAFADRGADVVGYTDRMRLADDQVYAIGWVRNPATGKPGRWIIVTDEATNILEYTEVAENREDVARQFRSTGILRSGWRLAFHQSRLAPGLHRLTAWLFLPEEHKALKLPNDFQITIPRPAEAQQAQCKEE